MAPKPAKIIYFPMEIASRELDSRLLLAVLAARHGFESVLGQKWLIERNIERMTPGVYLSKTLTVRDAKMLRRAKEAGYITAAVDEEIPGLVVHDKKFWWVARDAVDSTDLIFLPGTFNSAAFVEAFQLPDGQVRQASNPRWDLLRSELRTIFADQVAELRQRHGNFILVNSNLGFTNSHKGDSKHMVQALIDQGKIDPSDRELMRQFDDFEVMEQANRVALLELLPALAEAFPEQRIVLRPHPSENSSTWEEWTRGFPNLSILREGSSLPWIMAARALVHTNCTTGVEAIALDRPAICLVPAENPAHRRYLANLVNPVVRTTAEAVAAIRRLLADPGSCYDLQMVARFRDSMSYDSARMGAEQIVSSIEEFGDARGGWRASPDAVSAWHPLAGYRWHQPDKNVRGDLFPDLDLAAVAGRLNQFGRILGIAADLKIEACGTKVLLVSPRALPLSTRIRRAVGRW
ncbi:MAG TPA: surface carbohydrate biosynthesis protein [Dongiaceae bacterium]|jgi:surface carbohydrate biosynthesis protein|nr:surface carbohydrate biosynthesis protein [Dongiaceae bacterium]